MSFPKQNRICIWLMNFFPTVITTRRLDSPSSEPREYIWTRRGFSTQHTYMLYISVANIQNPFSVHLVKLRKRALKFLAHFSLVCLGKCPKAHEKWSQMEKLIWGYIFHPSGMLWRPFGGRFLRVLHPKGVFRSLFLRISCFYKSSKPLSGANAPGRGFDDLWLYSKCTGKGFWQWEGVLNVSKSSRGW